MTKLRLRSALAGVMGTLLLSAVFTAAGSTIAYDEAVNGDLPSIESMPFDVGNGVNYVKGTFGNGTSTDSADIDAFRIRFAPGQVLESATLSWALDCVSCPTGGDSGFTAGWQNEYVWYVIGPADPAPALVDATTEIRGPRSPLLIPLESTFRSAFAAPTVPPVRYTWTFTVVPAPGAAWLLGTAVLTVACREIRHLRKNRA